MFLSVILPVVGDNGCVTGYWNRVQRIWGGFAEYELVAGDKDVINDEDYIELDSYHGHRKPRDSSIFHFSS